MEDECIRCSISGEEVRLYDAVYDGSINPICERCSIIENIPIIKKPNYNQLKEVERRQASYDKIKLNSSGKNDVINIKEKLNELDSNPRLELPENQKFNLIDNFHWEVMRNRRRKGYSKRQLAEIIGESELYLEMIEKGIIPDSDENIIVKLEQALQMRLRKEIPIPRKGPILLDEDGNELLFIPEPEIECRVEIIEESEDLPLLNNIPTVKCSTPKPEDERRIESRFENSRRQMNSFPLEDINSTNMNFSNTPWRRTKEEIKEKPKEEEKIIQKPSESVFLKRIKEREEAYRNMKESKDYSMSIEKNDNTDKFSGHIDSIKAKENVTNRMSGRSYGEEVEQIILESSPKDEVENVRVLEKKIDDWKFSQKDLDNITIDDLRRLHKRRVEASRQEQFEEQKNIVEKEKIVEARKEGLRMMKEKESREIDSFLGGKELIEGNPNFKSESQ